VKTVRIVRQTAANDGFFVFSENHTKPLRFLISARHSSADSTNSTASENNNVEIKKIIAIQWLDCLLW